MVSRRIVVPSLAVGMLLLAVVAPFIAGSLIPKEEEAAVVATELAPLRPDDKLVGTVAQEGRERLLAQSPGQTISPHEDAPQAPTVQSPTGGGTLPIPVDSNEERIRHPPPSTPQEKEEFYLKTREAIEKWGTEEYGSTYYPKNMPALTEENLAKRRWWIKNLEVEQASGSAQGVKQPLVLPPVEGRRENEATPGLDEHSKLPVVESPSSLEYPFGLEKKIPSTSKKPTDVDIKVPSTSADPADVAIKTSTSKTATDAADTDETREGRGPSKVPGRSPHTQE